MRARNASVEVAWIAGSRRIACRAALVMVMSAAHASAQTTWVVDDDNCPGPGAGTVGDPFCAIAFAISASANGDTIIVADGEYTGPNNRNLSFDGLAIELRSENGPEDCIVNGEDVTQILRFDSSETNTSILDGFTFTFGFSFDGGSAVLCRGSSPTIRNCHFINNFAQMGLGGAVLIDQESEAHLDRCRFELNIAASGGGLAIVTAAPTITHCVFENNTAVLDFGGGLFSSTLSSPTIVDCDFIENRTFGGGEIGGNGGGMYFSASDPTVIRCRLLRNEAEIGGFGRGGGVFSGVGDGTLTDCIFEGNSAAFGAGLACIISSPLVVNGRFSGNVARNRAGAVYAATNADITLDNCTLTGNLSLADAGGVFTTGSAEPVFTNSILWNNSPNEIVGLTLAEYSIVEGGYPGIGNVNEPPLFVRDPDIGPDNMWGTSDDDYGDLHVSPGSPAINAGDPAVPFDPLETDLDGHARVLCGRVDMGVYEFGLGDANCDQVVNVFDFGDWLDCFTGPGAGPYGAGCEAFDADGDVDVDWADFAIIQLTFSS